MGELGRVTVTIDEPEGASKSGFMLLRRPLATAPSRRLGRSAAWPGDEVALQIERVVDGGMDTEEALRGSS